MKKCERCGIILIDPSGVCPLCRSVVKEEQETAGLECLEEPSFPFADRRRKRICFARNIYLFAMIVLIASMIFLNLYLHCMMWWTVIVAASVVCGYITFVVTVLKPVSAKLRVTVQSLMGFLLLLLIDWLTGYQGWALNYVFPIYLPVMDIIILVMMLIDKFDWQSYLFMEFVPILLSFLAIPLSTLHTIHLLIPASALIFFTVVIFAGTLVIGGTRAVNELARRFHR